MKNHHINIYPIMSDFIKIFDIPFENGFDNGDIAYQVKNYSGKEITPRELYDNMVSCHFGVFGATHTLPECIEKMNIEIVEQDKEHFVVFNLPAFLGLPCNDWKKEMQELKDFLIWFKEEAISNSQYNIKLSFMRVGEKVDFNIVSESDKLEEDLNKKMEEKVSSSKTLTQWVINQKKGYKEIEKQCYDLWISMDAMSLMSFKEQNDYVESKPQKKEKHIVKNHRKNKY